MPPRAQLGEGMAHTSKACCGAGAHARTALRGGSWARRRRSCLAIGGCFVVSRVPWRGAQHCYQARVQPARMALQLAASARPAASPAGACAGLASSPLPRPAPRAAHRGIRRERARALAVPGGDQVEGLLGEAILWAEAWPPARRLQWWLGCRFNSLRTGEGSKTAPDRASSPPISLPSPLPITWPRTRQARWWRARPSRPVDALACPPARQCRGAHRDLQLVRRGVVEGPGARGGSACGWREGAG